MEHGRYKLVFLLAVSALATLDANGIAEFIGAVVQEKTIRGTSVGVGRKGGGIRINRAHIIEVIGIGETVQYFKPDIDPVVECVFDPTSKWNIDGHRAVVIAALAFGTQGTKLYFSSLQVRIRIEAEHTHAKSDIGCKTKRGIAGHKPEEIEITLQGQFPDPAVKAQVAGLHIGVVCIIYVRVTQLGKGGAYPDCDIIPEVFPEEHRCGEFGPVQFGPGYIST